MATKTAKDKVLEFINKNYVKEQDKWLSGMKNSMQEWEDVMNDFNKLYNSYSTNDEVYHELVCKINRYEQILKRYGITDR